jgi:hypothetical protein
MLLTMHWVDLCQRKHFRQIHRQRERDSQRAIKKLLM